MKLGLAIPKFFEPSLPEPYRKTFELTALAEEVGFEIGSVPHHSFTPDTEDYAAPFVMMAALAARTSRLKIASTIFILPLHNPVAVAEQLAEFDCLSGGRAIFGTAVGYREYEAVGLGVDFHTRGERMDEALTLIRQGFERGYFEFSGKHYTVPRSVVAPTPIQKPYPPMWIGGTVDAALRRAARLADGWISENLYMVEGMKERIATYRRFCAEAGRRAGTVCLIRNACIASNRTEVERNWLPGMIDYHLFNRRNYRNAGMTMPDPDGVYARLEAGGTVGLAEFARDRLIAGTPDDCIGQLKRWEAETGAEYVHLILGPHPANEDEFEACRRAVKLFGKHVIPAL